MVLWITTLYCGPRSRTGRGRGKEGRGLFPEQALLCFSKEVSPALASEIGYKAALLPSFELARRELARTGLDLGIKTIHTTACRVGFEVLTARKRDLLLWREGQLPPGTVFKGKRVGVMPDGGRIRLRECFRPQRWVKCKGRHKLRPRSWQANWREPKLFVIFELDEKGRMKAGSKPYIDGTLQGPDAFMELLAMRLHQLGVVNASEVVFGADGGTWIWNRIDTVTHMLGLDSTRVIKVLDFFHAAHHLHLALNALGFDAEAHARVFRRQRRQLYKGRIDLIMEELRDFAKALNVKASQKRIVQREINYFEKHAPNMNYRMLRTKGRPMGSGAIESAVRRVLNQRLKGNGIQWYADNAEAIMALRCAVLADRFDDTLAHARATMATNREIDWKWSSPDMRAELIPDEADHATEPIVVTIQELKRNIA